MASSLDLARTFTSFSGVDIKVIIGGEPVGEMQALSYAVQREKAPLYVMGRVDPLAFSRGKRGIAGTLISLLLDAHLIYNHDVIAQSEFIADKNEVYPNVLTGDIPPSEDELSDGEEPALTGSDVTDLWEAKQPFYVDQIMPFDIAVVAVNEQGKASQMRIYGVEILNEGSGFSIDDIVIENQMTYVCRTILPWQKMGQWLARGSNFGPWRPAKHKGSSPHS